MKKKIIITLSRVFPVTHSRRGEPTGFAGEVDRFDFSALNITLAIKVLLKRIYEIEFVISK